MSATVLVISIVTTVFAIRSWSYMGYWEGGRMVSVSTFILCAAGFVTALGLEPNAVTPGQTFVSKEWGYVALTLIAVGTVSFVVGLHKFYERIPRQHPQKHSG